MRTRLFYVWNWQTGCCFHMGQGTSFRISTGSVQVKKMKDVRVSNFSQNNRVDTGEEWEFNYIGRLKGICRGAYAFFLVIINKVQTLWKNLCPFSRAICKIALMRSLLLAQLLLLINGRSLIRFPLAELYTKNFKVHLWICDGLDFILLRILLFLCVFEY